MKNAIGYANIDDTKYSDTFGVDPVKYSDGGTSYDDNGTAYTPPIVADESSPYGDKDLTVLGENVYSNNLPPYTSQDGKPMNPVDMPPPQIDTSYGGGGTQAVLPGETTADDKTNWLLIGGVALAAYFLFFNKR